MTLPSEPDLAALEARLTAIRAMPSLAAYDELATDAIAVAMLRALDRPDVGLREAGDAYEIQTWVRHEPSGVVVLKGHPQLGGRYCMTDGGDWPCATVRTALAATDNQSPEPARDDWLENIPKWNAPDPTGQWHQWIKVEDVVARLAGLRAHALSLHRELNGYLVKASVETDDISECRECSAVGSTDDPS